MSLETLMTTWIICGAISAIWHVVDEWWQHEVMEHDLKFTIPFTLFFAVFAFVLGPIGLVVKVWEKWFDPSNC
jgi:hypothetical protein